MCEQNLTRRQLVRYGALVSATFPALGVLDRGWTLADQAESPRAGGLVVPMHLELVTVTDTSAVITWFTGDPTRRDEFGRPRPVAAPGRVLIGTSPDPRTWRVVGRHDATAYHYVEVTGLRPGTTYFWRAESSGRVAIPLMPTPTAPLVGPAPPVFTTMRRPGGREIGRVAWLNDLHFGEQVAGLAYSNPDLPGGGLPPGFPVDPEHPYWRFMAQGAVADARRRGCNLLLANGDLSNESEPAALRECRRTLDGFGTLGGRGMVRPGDAPRYHVTRGNHDRQRPHVSGRLVDEFDRRFDRGFERGSQHFSVAVGTKRARYRFVGLDSNDGENTGVLRRSELDYLEAELEKGDITIPLFHHPASLTASAIGIPPFIGGLAQDDARAFRQLIARHPNTGGVYAGHTHRNNLSRNVETGRLPYFEGGAVKEYPGGYSVVRLFERGYMVNFYKTRRRDARAWSERSRGEYFGLAPSYLLGGLHERNWSYEVDARRRTRLSVRPAAGATEPVDLDGIGAVTDEA
ncbi:fibronectin type III domain-containing protein [Nocardioides sp. SYSU DS0663]|uniref:fibronectin type III domain-containing protein n=1 Tax=Nocardioides sp. SYSU DS0663 TaxID=3416445 RepID=UPI003F4B1B94